jgi:hypothetical protein
MNVHTSHKQRSASHAHAGGVQLLIAGIVLVAAWWAIAWLQVRPLSDYYFFPLWLGYILTVDGLVAIRTGTSPIQRGGWRVAWLFVASVPLWWLFEGFNQIVDNWEYHLPRPYGPVTYALLASLAFSTVMPAVLTTTELVRSFGLNPLRRLPRLQLSNPTLLVLHGVGWLMILAILLWPGVAFPLVWIAMIFMLDPPLTWLGGRSIGSFLRQGDWSPMVNLGLATLICGFFWEFWNVRALPKWTYDVPHLDWLHLFEMPILGYGGYIPFGIEVYVVYALLRLLAIPGDTPLVPVSSRRGVVD